MDFIGTWKLKEMLWLYEGKFRRINDTEIEAMEDNDANRELKRMLAADFIISETSLDVIYRPREGEEALAYEKGWRVTDRGLIIDSFPCKIEDGVLMVDYMKKGLDYYPSWVDESGVLSLSGGILRIKRG